MTISKGTIVRTITLALVLLNLLLEKIGVDIIKTDESTIMMLLEYIIEIAAIIASWWYNNSFSENALKAQKFLDQLKNSETV